MIRVFLACSVGQVGLWFGVAQCWERVSVMVAQEDQETEAVSGYTPLMSAARAGQVEAIRELVRLGVSVNIKNEHGWTAVRLATRENRLDAVRALVDLGADLSIGGESYDGGVLMMAARQGNIDLVRYLADRVNVNERTGVYGGSALHAAAFAGNSDVSGVLLMHGADVDIRADLDVTPLHVAALAGESEVVRLLLAAKASAFAADSLGRLPLHYAVRHPLGRTSQSLVWAMNRVENWKWSAPDNCGLTPAALMVLHGNWQEGVVPSRLLSNKCRLGRTPTAWAARLNAGPAYDVLMSHRVAEEADLFGLRWVKGWTAASAAKGAVTEQSETPIVALLEKESLRLRMVASIWRDGLVLVEGTAPDGSSCLKTAWIPGASAEMLREECLALGASGLGDLRKFSGGRVLLLVRSEIGDELKSVSYNDSLIMDRDPLDLIARDVVEAARRLMISLIPEKLEPAGNTVRGFSATGGAPWIVR